MLDSTRQSERTTERELIERDIEGYLAQEEHKDILRFLTAGSVDDGKSTLIGRLLHDSNMVYDDQLAALRRDSAKKSSAGGEVDYSLLVDGLLSEREQGITIDVAYRYFATVKRKFIIADTPGHEQYTRNMATGASTADLAILLVDAKQGILSQTRRHSFIASLLGIRHVVVAVNKMDLVGYDEAVFEGIREAFLSFAQTLGFGDICFLPLSALRGDNVVTKSEAMPWYAGPPLLGHLETVELSRDRNLGDLRFPVQLVIRPSPDFRGFAGTVASGVLRRGDAVTALPSGRGSRVRSIVTYDGELEEAAPPMAVTVTLEDEIDLSRGDVLVRADSLPHVARSFEATVVWMNDRPLRPGASYLLKHGTKVVTAELTALHHGIDVTSLERRDASELGLNDIGRVTLTAARPLIFDPYTRNRATGAFILIDRLTNATLGAGMIAGPAAAAGAPEELGRVTRDERERRLGQRGVALWIAGGQGVAAALERRLWGDGYTAHLVDAGAEADGASRAAAFASACAELGLIAIVSAPASAAPPAGERVVVATAEPGAPLEVTVERVTALLRRGGFLR